MQNKYLIKKLILNNFMLHENTSFELNNAPITLLTGANGSGKTQVLDSLIMAFGHYPKRLKKSGISSAIGSFADCAKITLELYLPKKISQQMDVSKELKDILSKTKEKFDLTTTITQDGVEYHLITDSPIKLKRKHVRQLFKHLSIKAENKLAFTEEGTVNIFTDHSSRNKLDLFLQTTGLTDYRDNIVQSLEATEKAKTSIEPLKRKLHFENEYLEKINETRHLISKKKALQEEHENLVIEEAWSKVSYLEKEISSVTDEHKEQTQVFLVHKKNFEIANNHNHTIEKELQQNNKLLLKSKISVEEKQSHAQRLYGRNQSNSKILEDTNNKKQEFTKQLNTLLKSNTKEKINEIKQRIQEVEKEKEKIAGIRKLVGENFFNKNLSTDREYLSHTIYLHELFKTKKVSVHGPLFLEIKANKPSQKAIWKMLGFYCFLFVAKTKKDYEAATKALDEMKLERSPIAIAYYNGSGVSKSVYSIEKHLESDDNIKSFLDKSLGLRFAKTAKEVEKIFKEDRNALVVWDNSRLHYRNNITSLGWYPKILDFCTNLSIKELQKAIYANEIENKLAEEYNNLQKDYEEANAFKEIQYLEERIAEVSIDIENLEREIKSIENETWQTEKKLSKEKNIFDEIEEKIAKLKDQEKILNDEISELITQKSIAEQQISKLEEDLKEKQSALETAIKEAEEVGDRPALTRTLETIIKKRLHIEGQLSSIEITPVSEEVYTEQKAKVEKLSQEVQGATEHISNLQTDITARFEAWHKDVASLLKSMSTSMNYLLSDIAKEVRIRIENIKDPINAGMHIELKRHSKKWLDLSNLSGGEKVLTIEALILSMHLQTDSLVHAIDECTQRLDLKFKAMAFEMVQRAVENLQNKATGFYTPQFLLLAPDTLGVIFDEEANKYFHRVVLAPAVSTT